MIKRCEPSPTEDHVFASGQNTCTHCGAPGFIMNGEALYVPTPKQIDYHARTEPNVLFWGGRGSGKSMCGRWDAHMRALAYPGFKYCILRRTFPQLESSHLVEIPGELQKLGGEKAGFSYNDTKHIITYPNGSKGFFSHCADEKAVLNLLSSQFYLMVFDELSTFEWDMFTKLSSSVRVPKGSGLLALVRGLTNPLGPSAQKVLEYFVEKNVDPEDDPRYNPDKWYAIHANLEHNPYLDQEQYRERFSGLASHVRKAWEDGEFILENSLFDFQPKLKTNSGEVIPYHVIHDIDLPKLLKSAVIYRAIDSGWFPDPTVVLWIAHLGNRHIVFNEVTRYKTTADEMAEIIKAEDKRLGVTRVAMTYCDPSMDFNTTADIRTIKEIYEANGVPMECSINNREYFATAMHDALAQEAGENLPRIQFYVSGRDGCRELVKTIPQMRFDPKRPKAMDDHKDDHWVVACAYYLMSHSSDLRQEAYPGGSQVRPWMKEKDSPVFRLGSEGVRSRY